MNMAAASNLTRPSYYDPEDDAVLRNSPVLAQHNLKLRLSPTPPPINLPPKASPSPSSGHRKSSRRKTKPSQGDVFLLSTLDGGRDPDIARHAAVSALVSDTESGHSSDDSQPPQKDESKFLEAERARPNHVQPSGDSRRARARRSPRRDPAPQQLAMTANAAKPADAALMSIAAGALAVTGVSAGPAQPSTTQPRNMPREKRPPGPVPSTIAIRGDGAPRGGRPPALPYTPLSVYSPHDTTPGHPTPHHHNRPETTSPTAIPPSGRGELPPIHSPASETNGLTSLPSLKDQLGDLKDFNAPAILEHDRGRRHSAFSSQSPPGPLAQFSSMHIQQKSPPITPSDNFRRDIPSPGHHILPTRLSPPQGSYYHSEGAFRPAANPHCTETPNTDLSGTTPATSTSDRSGLDAITQHQPPALYICRYPDCRAPAFQTQYLLNSHANVHSSSRPHFCPVKECPRSYGGKGFKRKNEMIRHGLVHDSPGYVCPFCPDREHKYPRPDNLQRHVRVHHVDKSKDDPMLRNVLSQRPDGPNRGRRRRGGPS